jgi:Fe-S-cluster containining protein
MSSTPLPDLYAKWMEDALGSELPAEPRATCHDCVMCKGAAQPAEVAREVRFSPNSKCCTYVPLLPNYLVGKIIKDHSDEAQFGRTKLLERLKNRVGATPFGMVVDAYSARIYERLVAEDQFGRDDSFRCPYYNPDGGLCGIWRHRNAVCSTWFCKYERRAIGARFWLSVRNLLLYVERELATYCVFKLGVDQSAVNELFDANGHPRALKDMHTYLEDDTGRMDNAVARLLWGQWYDKEETFYGACAELVGDLTWSSVLHIVGTQTSVLTHRARQAFDGRPTVEVMQELGRDKGVVIEPSLLHTLIEHQALVPLRGRDVPPIRADRGPVSRHDRLCFFRGFRDSEVESKHSVVDGKLQLEVQCGTKQLTFDDPELLAFGRNLVVHQNGFRAQDAVHWADPGKTYAWEQVSELFDTLLAEGILQRMP